MEKHMRRLVWTCAAALFGFVVGCTGTVINHVMPTQADWWRRNAAADA
jgi:hypothetical protein